MSYKPMQHNFGIKAGAKWHNTPAAKRARKQRLLSNRKVRAALYSRLEGEAANKHAAEWHGTLKGLSNGTGG